LTDPPPIPAEVIPYATTAIMVELDRRALARIHAGLWVLAAYMLVPFPRLLFASQITGANSFHVSAVIQIVFSTIFATAGVLLASNTDHPRDPRPFRYLIPIAALPYLILAIVYAAALYQYTPTPGAAVSSVLSMLSILSPFQSLAYAAMLLVTLARVVFLASVLGTPRIALQLVVIGAAMLGIQLFYLSSGLFARFVGVGSYSSITWALQFVRMGASLWAIPVIVVLAMRARRAAAGQ
jgi:hypothetical protein